MNDAHFNELVQSLDAAVRAACSLLRQPTPLAIGQSAICLEAAMPGLDDLERFLAGAESDRTPGKREVLNQLRRGVCHVSAMLKQSGEFYFGAESRRGLFSPGYTIQGTPEAAGNCQRLSVEA